MTQDSPDGSTGAGRPGPGESVVSGSTTGRRIEAMLGVPCYTLAEVAEASGLDVNIVRRYWRSLGFPDPAPADKHFTETDVQALRQLAGLVAEQEISFTTAQNLVRAQGHSMDRLVLWQVEALVEDAAKRHELDDTSARLLVLDKLGGLAPVLAEQAEYVWRRQLAALMSRIDRDLSQSDHAASSAQQLPLERAIGFIDIVSYTTRAATLSATQLASLVGEFESAARDVIARYGGRVVKTVGDAVLWVADDLPSGAWVGTGLLEAMAARNLPIRGSLVWGRVLSRSGDVFGPIVNLASRLADVAIEGELLMDAVSAALLRESGHAGDFEISQLPEVDVPGLGSVSPARLVRRPEA
ncbi:adenylate/guanylate cyclase domain-containing protein [Pseudactinotalea sp. Z1748]|uniref:adenylate/guanylate cyclase domain-containing protein n=1 Tax=Pseudactinotalea sp. Z1748 TaxID=3413027 RepID=UPI003C7CD967